MNIMYNLFFMLVGIIIGTIIVYTRAHFKYEDKDRIDKCYKERKEIKEEKQKLEKLVENLKEDIKKLKEELQKSKKEIMERNKYLAENAVIIERLYEVKKLSDKISETLIDYDKDTIQQLLEGFKKGELCEYEHKKEAEKEAEKKHW